MRVVTSVLVIAALLGVPVRAAAPQPLAREAEVAAYKQMAAGIPLGARIKVQTDDGRRLTATLMAVEYEALLMKRESRVPEPAVRVAFARITRLQLEEKSGFSLGKAVGIGLAAGVGAILTLFAIAVTIDD